MISALETCEGVQNDGATGDSAGDEELQGAPQEGVVLAEMGGGAERLAVVVVVAAVVCIADGRNVVAVVAVFD